MKKPNIVMVGRIEFRAANTEEPTEEVEYGIIIKCESAAQVRDAMNTGNLSVIVFGGDPETPSPLDQFWRDVITGLNRPASGIKPHFFQEKYLKVKGSTDSTFTTRELRAALATGDFDYEIDTRMPGKLNQVRVLFFDLTALYDEWLIDLRNQGRKLPASLQSLKLELQQQSWHIPAPKARGAKHIQRLSNKATVCECISINQEFESALDNPFAEELILALTDPNA